MKKFALTVAVLTLGLAACQDNAADNNVSALNTVEAEAEADTNAAANDAEASADSALNAAGNALEDAGNAVENGAEAVENAAN